MNIQEHEKIIEEINDVVFNINNNTDKAIFTNINGFGNKFIAYIYNNKPDLNNFPTKINNYFCIDLLEPNELEKFKEKLIQIYLFDINCKKNNEIKHNKNINEINVLLKSINKIISNINNSTDSAVFSNIYGYDSIYSILIFNNKPNLNSYPFSPDKFFYVNLFNNDESVVSDLIKLKSKLINICKNKITPINLINKICNNANGNEIKYIVTFCDYTYTIKQWFFGANEPSVLYIGDTIESSISFITNQIKNNPEYHGYCLCNGGYWKMGEKYIFISGIDGLTGEEKSIGYNEDNTNVDIDKKIRLHINKLG